MLVDINATWSCWSSVKVFISKEVEPIWHTCEIVYESKVFINETVESISDGRYNCAPVWIWVARFPILNRAKMTNKSWLFIVVMLKHAAEKTLRS